MAGILPRTFAQAVLAEGLEPTLQRAKDFGFLSADETCNGTEAHYDFFESLMTGRDMNSGTQPSNLARRLFPAQVSDLFV